MSTVSRKGLLAGLATAGVLGAGIAVPSLAFADGATPGASPSAATSAGSSAVPDKSEHAARETAFAEALAKELGVPTDKVQAALEKVRGQLKPPGRPDGADRSDPADRRAALKERLATAVEDGRLSQQQADAITAAIDAGVFPGGGERHRFGPPGR